MSSILLIYLLLNVNFKEADSGVQVGGAHKLKVPREARKVGCMKEKTVFKGPGLERVAAAPKHRATSSAWQAEWMNQ